MKRALVSVEHAILLLALLVGIAAYVVLPAGSMFAASAPALCVFEGTLQVNGQNVPNGTVIVATVGGDTYTATTSDSTYMIAIAQPGGENYEGLT
jgi:spore germination protein YaaH